MQIKSFKEYFFSFIQVKKTLHVFSEFFRNGFYYYRGNELRRGIVWPRPFITVLDIKKKIVKCEKAIIIKIKLNNTKKEKMIIKAGNLVLSYYASKTTRKSLHRISKYIENIPYTHPPFISINVNKGKLVTFFQDNCVLYSNKDALLAGGVFILNSNMKQDKKYGFYQGKSKTIEKMLVFQLQHGDLDISNILLTDNQNYKFSVIDFDTIGYYPALYDFFRYILYVPYLIDKFFEGFFDKNISDLFSETTESNKDVNIIKDNYLSYFISICPWPTENFSKKLPQIYVNTKSALNNPF